MMTRVEPARGTPVWSRTSLSRHIPEVRFMLRLHRLAWLLFAPAVLITVSRGDDRPDPPKPPTGGNGATVYGEWRIKVKPDKGPDYDRLIEQSGLPLFREAGGRLVGWWKTLVGDLYEHVTIWEYDNMAGFERAIGFLSKNPAFARFVAARPAPGRRGEPIPASGPRGHESFIA